MKFNFEEGNRFNTLKAMVNEAAKNEVPKDETLTAVKVMCKLIDYPESDLWMETLVNDAYVEKLIDVAIEATPANYSIAMEALHEEFGVDHVVAVREHIPTITVHINKKMSLENAERFKHALHEAFPDGYAYDGDLT